jgi:hypothetical protein
MRGRKLGEVDVGKYIDPKKREEIESAPMTRRQIITAGYTDDLMRWFDGLNPSERRVVRGPD